MEAIEPRRGGLLRMYSCGPTVCRYAHIGSLRSCLLADLIRRNAEHRHRVTVLTCQGIADVGHLTDGPAANGPAANGPAAAEGKTAPGLATIHEDAFRADCSALNLRPAEYSPRASDQIGLMIDMIARLIEAGHAYPTSGGSVYFDARSFPGYGELSGGPVGDLRPGHRSDSQAGGGRRFHADWALWQGAAEGRELTWPAPWGSGRPGWDTECTALSLHCLGDVIDVHAGGIDLRFPHHENERAQSNSVTGHEVVRHWVHAGRLLFDGRTMAGATRNVVLLPRLAGRGLDPLALRLAFLEHRYRSQMDLTWAALDAADRALRRWRELVADWANSPSKPMCAQVTGQIAAAFDDDLDTPAALAALRALEHDQQIPPGSKFETFAYTDQLLGLDLARDVGR